MTASENDRIADPLDRAAAETEAALTTALSFRKPEGPRANGSCHNCGAPLAPELRWCDRACCADWEGDRELARRSERPA